MNNQVKLWKTYIKLRTIFTEIGFRLVQEKESFLSHSNNYKKCSVLVIMFYNEI